jgi:hypothetical protein
MEEKEEESHRKEEEEESEPRENACRNDDAQGKILQKSQIALMDGRVRRVDVKQMWHSGKETGGRHAWDFMARMTRKAESEKRMDSMVLENVRVWKSSITHELFIHHAC